jgi:hypothetical protein
MLCSGVSESRMTEVKELKEKRKRVSNDEAL